MIRAISPAALRELLLANTEFALLDVREQGVHCQGHPFFASALPLSRLELTVGDLVPRRGVPLVLLDGGDEGLAERAAAKLAGLGYTDIAILEGGCAGWKASGSELFSGVNVPSKAFGEFVEHRYNTPRVPPQEIRRLIDSGRKLVILDSRPYEEYHRMNIPGGIDAPGAELVYCVHELAPDPDTLVVVNCAGRTRSIIGCQSLRNAGIANEVVALKDGTMGWELAGYECERGSTAVAPVPSAAGQEQARIAAERVARRFEVKFASRAQLEAWQRDSDRTLYLLDVRTRQEFEQLRIAGSRHAPGGQLIQATDEFVGVRGARIVCIDPARVRSVMTASWLNQMGWNDVYVLEPEGADGFAGWALDAGPRSQTPAGFKPWRTVTARELVQSRQQGGVTVLDLATSLRFRDRHIPGAWWAVRARLDQARAKLADARMLVLTSEDATLAHLAAPEAAPLWPNAEVRVLKGGNAIWFAVKLPTESGIDNATTSTDDVWYKPYDHAQDYEEHARAYLSWEVALVEQIKRDPAIRFRAYEQEAVSESPKRP
jgi:rhodanese-related sulfurtransferase